MTQDSTEEHHYEHIKTTQDSTEGRHYEHVTVINYRKDKTINGKRLIVLLRDYEDLSEDGPANYIKELEAKLKISEEIGRAFEEDAGQLRAKLDKAVTALRYVVSAKGLTDPTECGYEAIKHAREALDNLERMK
jgi:hypothetical protein